MKTPASVTISRGAEHKIRIKIQDQASYAFVEVELNLADYAMATTSAQVEGIATWSKLDLVGTRRETKVVSVPRSLIPNGNSKVIIAAVVREYLAPQCVDGWQVHCDGTSSRQDGSMWRAVLVRYVAAAEKESER